VSRFVLCGNCEWEQHGVASSERCMCQCHPFQQKRRKSKPASNAGRLRIVRRLMERDGRHCYWCRVEFRGDELPTIEHVVPKSYGGSNHLHNLVLACDWCNQKRGVMTPREFRVWLRRNWVPPERRRRRRA
jgi:5-methylcytosine-specific restriction endonuclease McrA